MLHGAWAWSSFEVHQGQTGFYVFTGRCYSGHLQLLLGISKHICIVCRSSYNWQINSHVWELVFSLDTCPATSSSVNVAWTEGCTCAARFSEDAYKKVWKHRPRPICGKVCPHFTQNSLVVWQILTGTLCTILISGYTVQKHYINVLGLLSTWKKWTSALGLSTVVIF